MREEQARKIFNKQKNECASAQQDFDDLNQLA